MAQGLGAATMFRRGINANETQQSRERWGMGVLETERRAAARAHVARSGVNVGKPLEDRPSRLYTERARKQIAAGAGKVEFESKQKKLGAGVGNTQYEASI